MRTYVRVGRGDDPARRPRRVLRVGRAARRSAPARPPGDRRDGASCSRPATRPRRTASAPRWADGRPAGCVPHAVVVRPRMSAYSEASKAVFEVFDDTTPLVEGLSIDEAFLDVGGLRRISGTPTEIAVRLRRDVREHVGLPITVGVARTKFLAKVASGVAKPDGLLVVPPDGELAFLHPLAGRAALGRRAGDRRQAARARDHDRRRGRRARRGRRWSRCSAAASGRHLHALAHNRDPRPVQVGRRRGSIGSQHALGRRTPRTRDAIDAVVVGLVDRVTRRMRAAGRVGRTVVLRLRFDDFSRATRSHTLPRPTAHTQTILAAVRGLLAAAMPMIERRGLTLVGMAVANLEDDARRPARAAVRPLTAATPSTPRSTRCASGSDRPPSRGPCCSAASCARRCRCSPIGRAAVESDRASCEACSVVVADPYHANERHDARLVPFRAGDGLELQPRPRPRRARRDARVRCCSSTAPACARISSAPRCRRRSSTPCSNGATTSGSRTGAPASTCRPNEWTLDQAADSRSPRGGPKGRRARPAPTR